MNERRLVRSADGRVFAGVAAGLGSYLGVDPVVVRIIFAGLTLLGGAGLLLYLLLWAVIPDEAGGEPVAERLLRRLRTAPTWVRVSLLVVAALIALGEIGPVSLTALVVLLFALVVVLTRDGRASPQG